MRRHRTFGGQKDNGIRNASQGTVDKVDVTSLILLKLSIYLYTYIDQFHEDPQKILTMKHVIFFNQINVVNNHNHRLLPVSTVY